MPMLGGWDHKMAVLHLDNFQDSHAKAVCSLCHRNYTKIHLGVPFGSKGKTDIYVGTNPGIYPVAPVPYPPYVTAPLHAELEEG